MFYAHGQYIALGAVENSVGSRAQEQCKPLASVTSDHYQIHGFFVGKPPDFGGRMAQHNMLIFGRDANFLSQLVQLFIGLLLQLILH